MENADNRIMGTEKIPSLMIRMAIPSVIAQVINILYNIVDRIYIGHISGVGAAALTGVGLTFPIITLISAFSAFVGSGGAPLASIWMGKNDKKHAEKILGTGVFMLLCFSLILMAVFLIFQRPLLYAFGASDATIGYAMEYLTIYLIGTVFVEIALGLNPFIIAQGRSGTAMMSIVIGAVINIVLDPIFIFGFHMGVKGAAIATVISQAVSAAWNVKALMDKKAVLKIVPACIRPDLRVIGQIFSLGISPFIMRSTESLISIVLNHQLQKFGGDLYVGSLTIMQSVMQLFSAPLSGYTQGVQPIVSYNFGAGKFDRVRTTYRYMIFGSFLISFVTAASAMIFPEFYAMMFTNYRKGYAGIYGGYVDLWPSEWYPAHFSGTGTGKDFSLYRPFAEGDPAGASGSDLSQLLWSHGSLLCGTGGRHDLCSDRKYFVPLQYQENTDYGKPEKDRIKNVSAG